MSSAFTDEQVAAIASPVATVPVIVVLKMAAFLDRPWERERDLQDLATIFLHYLGPYDKPRWEPPLEEVEFREHGAMALGIDIAAIAAARHSDLAHEFLAAVGPDTPHRARMGKVAAVPLADKEEVVAAWLQAFERGLQLERT